jgi:hypothetical protein
MMTVSEQVRVSCRVARAEHRHWVVTDLSVPS